MPASRPLGGFSQGKSTTFALDIARFCAKAKGRADLVVRKVSLDVLSRVVKRTPVDSGRARGNWQASIGSQATGETGATDKSGGTTVAAGKEVTDRAHAGDVVWLINNVPYIRKLETGSSKQAPAGMVGITIEEFRPIVGEAVLQAKSEMP